MQYQQIWDFLQKNPLSDLTVNRLKDFSGSDAYNTLNDDDLYKLLFKQVQEKVEAYFLDNFSMDTKDTLFDLILSTYDFYQEKKVIFQKIEQEIIFSPKILCDLYVYTLPTVQLILDKLSIQSVTINEIPIILQLRIPPAGIFLFMQALLGYIIHIFIHSIDEESFMIAVNNKLGPIDFN